MILPPTSEIGHQHNDVTSGDSPPRQFPWRTNSVNYRRRVEALESGSKIERTVEKSHRAVPVA